MFPYKEKDITKAPFRKVYVSKHDKELLTKNVNKVRELFEDQIPKAIEALEKIPGLNDLKEMLDATWEDIETISDASVGIDSHKCFWCNTWLERDEECTVKLVKICDVNPCGVKHWHLSCSKCEHEWITTNEVF